MKQITTTIESLAECYGIPSETWMADVRCIVREGYIHTPDGDIESADWAPSKGQMLDLAQAIEDGRSEGEIEEWYDESVAD